AAAPRHRQREGTGNRSFMAISLAVEYAGVRIEPLRRSTLAVQTAEGPRLVVCDPVAEQAAWTMLREALAGIAPDEAAPAMAPAPRAEGGGIGNGASSGWLTVAALPADGTGAARIKHELAGELQAQGWIVVDQAQLPTSVLDADQLLVDLESGTDPPTKRDADDASAQAAAPGEGSTVPGDGTTVRAEGTTAPADTPAAIEERGEDPKKQGTAGGQNTPEWFRLQSGIQVGDRRIDLAPLLAGIMAMGGFDAWKRARCPQGIFWMKVSDTEVLRLDAARIEPLARVVSSWAQLREDDADEHAMLLSPVAAAQLAGLVGGMALPEPVRKLRDSFESFNGIQPLDAPTSFLATLRPYQREGLGWLQFVAGAGLGGILADDMGLGKTVQVLAHIELERNSGRLAGPVLVVAPTSVVFNWQAEAARHAPALRLLALTGGGRSKRFSELGDHDLVLTSYALLARDAAVLRKQQWHAVILDEAQMIKNPRTHGAVAARELAANHRLALTGTPLENHLGELWSIMHFVLPGLLGSDEAFRSRFRTPIEKHPGTETAGERLRALETRIRPFMMRRTKQAVLVDLPPLTEMIQRVELPTEQRDLYESIRAAMDKRVREALSQAGLGRSQIVLLDALLKLRQACCDPALVKLPGARTVTRSAKRDALIELLATLVDEGRKALVFSQFTSMLDLIETAIDADPRLAGVARARLDGDTVHRGAAVARFQEGDAQLFLLSLKAGGVGLNLTAADTVIHYDPWWNPAVESQATDRAHRIGQEKPVFVYKLIAAGTVEERILALQARKAELAAAVLSGSLTAGGKALSQEDLLGLFEPL
ncbi:MAG TPA: DEAD/DEAH box helicase, partial [Lautropia sp.]|nr:DEAD/DEAH box helicase [Lautropia sp.]